MGRVERVESAAMLLDGEEIQWFGPQSRLDAPGGCESIDAGGGCVIPGLIDCHTHTVFAGTREHEFVQRIEGRSYEQIARSGGGIRVTVDAVRAATCEELVTLALPRLDRMLHNGVTTVEIKSGYGLTVDDELKMLKAIKRLGSLQPVEIVGTYLAAHTVPREFDGRAEAYLDTILDEKLLARIRDEKLADFCDVFCETTAFNVGQSRRALLAARKFGLTPKLHADQITQIGATVLAGEVGAVSADHLETIDDAGMAAMGQAGCVAVLLPGCSYFLGVSQAPARRILDANLPVAIATDYNPGSSMIESLPLVMNIAATQMNMTPCEVLVAVTANAAAALNRSDRIGAVAVGMQADLVILDVENVERMVYEPGRNCVRAVLKKGRIVAGRD